MLKIIIVVIIIIVVVICMPALTVPDCEKLVTRQNDLRVVEWCVIVRTVRYR